MAQETRKEEYEDTKSLNKYENTPKQLGIYCIYNVFCLKKLYQYTYWSPEIIITSKKNDVLELQSIHYKNEKKSVSNWNKHLSFVERVTLNFFFVVIIQYWVWEEAVNVSGYTYKH